MESWSPSHSCEDWISAKSWEKNLDNIHRCTPRKRQPEVSRGLIHLIPLHQKLCHGSFLKVFYETLECFSSGTVSSYEEWHRCSEHFKLCQHPLCAAVVRQTQLEKRLCFSASCAFYQRFAVKCSSETIRSVSEDKFDRYGLIGSTYNFRETSSNFKPLLFLTLVPHWV